jgi:sigma-B regulation protein RsbU (phosphoserine phosphatase)
MQASVRGLAHSVLSPSEVCRRLNRVALENSRSERFTTLFYGIVDSAKRSIRYCNAGHLPPLLIRKNGDIVRLSEGGTVLGVIPGAEYHENEVQFESGDRVVLVTDGFTEAINDRDEEFGEERLVQLLRDNGPFPLETLQRAILDSVEAFAGQALQDDATLMIIEA